MSIFGMSGAKRKVNRLINRDPNNQISLGGVSIEDSERLKLNNISGFTGARARAGASAGRGSAARSALNYQRMSRLGSSEAARALQKEASTELQNNTSALKNSGRLGADLMKFLK